jgi:hypothetical protein
LYLKPYFIDQSIFRFADTDEPQPSTSAAASAQLPTFPAVVQPIGPPTIFVPTKVVEDQIDQVLKYKFLLVSSLNAKCFTFKI